MRTPACSMATSTGIRGSSRERYTSASCSLSSSARRIGASCPARSARSHAKSRAASTGMSAKRQRLDALAADVFFRQRLVSRVLERQLFERVGRPGRVDQVAGDHRVEVEPVQPHTVPGEHDGVELQVVADLRHAPGLRAAASAPRAPRRAASDGGVAERPMARRHVIGLSRATSKTRGRRWRRASRTADRAARGTQTIRSPAAGAASARTPSIVSTIRYVRDDAGGGRRVLVDDRAEAQLVEDLEAPLGRGAAIAERVGVERRPAR